MVKLSDLLCNKSLGGSARRYLAPFRCHFVTLLRSVFVSTTLDGVTSFSHVNNVRNACKRQRYSQTVGEISVFDGGKFEESEGYNSLFVVFYVLESK